MSEQYSPRGHCGPLRGVGRGLSSTVSQRLLWELPALSLEPPPAGRPCTPHPPPVGPPRTTGPVWAVCSAPRAGIVRPLPPRTATVATKAWSDLALLTCHTRCWPPRAVPLPKGLPAPGTVDGGLEPPLVPLLPPPLACAAASVLPGLGCAHSGVTCLRPLMPCGGVVRPRRSFLCRVWLLGGSVMQTDAVGEVAAETLTCPAGGPWDGDIDLFGASPVGLSF